MNSSPLNTDLDFSSLLESIEHPAILLSPDYDILASNLSYRQSFGQPHPGERCYQISHGYDRPCDQAGESCPLAACKTSLEKERVLHIHNTPRGKEHIDVEMMPLKDANGEVLYFVEILKPVNIASAEIHRERMVGRSPAFNRVVELINLVAPRDASVLLLGESGSGKELAANAIHEMSQRADRNFVVVECAGLTEPLFESELFGHVKGAFTGATHNKPGLLEEAHGGTLFLDEIGDVPLGMQVKLLRLLETGAYRAVGSTQLKRADFRLVCATHKDLSQMVEVGEFRKDLYYRLNTFPITLPPLRERPDDIALIARSLLEKLAADRTYHLTDSAIKRLQVEPFPGNSRELRNVMERAIIFARSNVIDAQVLENCFDVRATVATVAEEEWLDLRTRERHYLEQLMTHCSGDKEKAAAIAGISVRSLYRKLETHRKSTVMSATSQATTAKAAAY
ncbi:sigma-54 interaction domain-containing protein [Parahaliea aestuarii]|uniref:PAS domain-containing protein n=1 Tax=Parahaliea aestuarii TaxID=1852021 RepID=A0A5C9A1D3_9GAMM|nr:sigma 54-interacting transcriptional regulator [Parahaliea aestuarii]TXS93590.1 PAS domain-containing protein [Parahaliea aestuarii]